MSRFIPLLIKGIEKRGKDNIRLVDLSLDSFLLLLQEEKCLNEILLNKESIVQVLAKIEAVLSSPKLSLPYPYSKGELEAKINLFKTQVERLQSEKGNQNTNDENEYLITNLENIPNPEKPPDLRVKTLTILESRAALISIFFSTYIETVFPNLKRLVIEACPGLDLQSLTFVFLKKSPKLEF